MLSSLIVLVQMLLYLFPLGKKALGRVPNDIGGSLCAALVEHVLQRWQRGIDFPFSCFHNPVYWFPLFHCAITITGIDALELELEGLLSSA